VIGRITLTCYRLFIDSTWTTNRKLRAHLRFDVQVFSNGSGGIAPIAVMAHARMLSGGDENQSLSGLAICSAASQIQS
jgi:hypothetical protein